MNRYLSLLMNKMPLTLTISPDWQPTSANIAQLPEPVRRYIMELETNADPAGMVRQNILLRDENRALQILISEINE